MIFLLSINFLFFPSLALTSSGQQRITTFLEVNELPISSSIVELLSAHMGMTREVQDRIFILKSTAQSESISSASSSSVAPKNFRKSQTAKCFLL